MTQYTGPERATERRLAKRKLAKILKAGGCAVCKHAVHGWGRSACDSPGRVFPVCFRTPGKQFELDEQKLQGLSHAPSK